MLWVLKRTVSVFGAPKLMLKIMGNKINIYYLTLEYLIFCFIYACFCCCCCFGLAHWTVTRDFADAKAPLNAKRASTRENLSSGFENNTVADQPAHPRSLVSAFVIRYLESIICKPATGEIKNF